jgi:hypothetical protein
MRQPISSAIAAACSAAITHTSHAALQQHQPHASRDRTQSQRSSPLCLRNRAVQRSRCERCGLLRRCCCALSMPLSRGAAGSARRCLRCAATRVCDVLLLPCASRIARRQWGICGANHNRIMLQTHHVMKSPGCTRCRQGKALHSAS